VYKTSSFLRHAKRQIITRVPAGIGKSTTQILVVLKIQAPLKNTYIRMFKIPE